MRKYFTWRCIGLHVLVVVLVPAFLLAGWWQYHVALSGNDLSWVYTVEWPFFAVYAVYIWWRLIHDERTPFDRLWAAKQRAAADASGRPLHQIPGWATDKELSREVTRASIEAARAPALADPPKRALASHAEEQVPDRPMTPALETRTSAEREHSPAEQGFEEHGDEPVIDARVVGVTVVVDEELDAYNRYLAELAQRDPPKRWRSTRRRRRAGDADSQSEAPGAPTSVAGPHPELPGQPGQPGRPGPPGGDRNPSPAGHDEDPGERGAARAS